MFDLETLEGPKGHLVHQSCFREALREGTWPGGPTAETTLLSTFCCPQRGRVPWGIRQGSATPGRLRERAREACRQGLGVSGHRGLSQLLPAGNSGMGSYHGKKSFETFSHRRSCLVRPLLNDESLKARYPPSLAKVRGGGGGRRGDSAAGSPWARAGHGPHCPLVSSSQMTRH